jgi:hypothetical protein
MTEPTPHAELGDNLSGNTSGAPGYVIDTPPKPPKTKAKPPAEKRVRIMLEDSDQIGPGGQFISADGRAFLIQPGYEVEVPLSVLDVLDHAVQSVPITDASRTVVGYRDRLRFPYRVIRGAGSGQREGIGGSGD